MVPRVSHEISYPLKLEAFDWVKAPAQFVEQLSAHFGRRTSLTPFAKPRTNMRTV